MQSNGPAVKKESTAKLRFFKNPVSVIALIVFLVILFACILAPVICKYGYAEMDVQSRFLRPCREHIFGCDYTGRDNFTRVLYGGRNTLRIAAVATVLSAAGGLALGVISGMVGGTTDMIIMRVMEILSSVPSLLLVILAECLMGWGKGNFMYAMALSALPSVVRLIRASVSQVMSKSYIEASRALGVKGTRLVFRHILPNILPSVFVHLTGTFAEQILLCSIMGYVGVGINAPQAEWGLIIFEGYASLRTAPFTVVIPAACIAICVLSVNLVGNGLRDAVDGGDRSDG